jgi:hypothetical protein
MKKILQTFLLFTSLVLAGAIGPTAEATNITISGGCIGGTVTLNEHGQLVNGKTAWTGTATIGSNSGTTVFVEWSTSNNAWYLSFGGQPYFQYVGNTPLPPNNSTQVWTETSDYNASVCPRGTPINISGTGTQSGSATVAVEAAPLLITALSPTRNQRNVPNNSNVAVSFDQALANTPASKTSLKVFSAQRGGRMQDGAGGTANVSDNTLTFDPTTNFKSGETIFTTATTASQSSGGGSLTHGQVQQFTVAVGGTGRGRLVAPAIGAEVGVGTFSQGLAVGDVDGDGDLDFVTTSGNTSTLSVRLNDGTGQFSGTGTVAVAAPSRDVALGDIDGDGDLDLVAAAYGTNFSSSNNTVSVRLNNGTGTFTVPAIGAEVAAEDRPNQVVLGDVDGDGDLDLVISMYNNSPAGVTLVRLNDGTGMFSGGQRLTAAADINTAGLGDVDNDGDLDLILTETEYSSGVAQADVRLNDGTGTFDTTPFSTTPLGSIPSNIALGDLDGDGDLDFVTADVNGGSVSIRFNNGIGTFAAGPGGDLNLSNAFQAVALGDLDADGDLDIVASLANSAEQYVYLNTGNGTFTAAVSRIVPVGDFPYRVVLADVDQDGDIDALTVNAISNSVSVRLNQPAVANPVTVASIVRTGGTNALTNAASVDFTVTFSGDVSGLSTNNFIVQTMGGVTTASVSGLSGSGSSYTVSVNTGTGDGTVQLQLANATGLTPGVSNVPFSGESYTIDKTRPTVAITSTASPSTTTSPIPLTFTFSENVTGFAANDVMLAGGTLDGFSGSGANYTASVTPTAAGTVTVNVAANVAQDAATNGNDAATQFSIQYALPGPATRYVNATRPDDSGDGLTWGTAHKYLQTALVAAQSGDQIWVAQGTYKPTTSPTDRSASFIMKENVKIYGGFTSGQANLTDRNSNPATNNTMLSGDINNDNALSGNSYHVVFNNENGLTAAAVLDGFTVTGGNADGNSSPSNEGGGMYTSAGSPTLSNCSFRANNAFFFGGGIYNKNNSRPTLTNCSFQDNSVAVFGGAICNNSSSPILENCTFLNNSAGNGGALSNQIDSSPTLTNCLFQSNTASNGGGMANYSRSTPSLTNCSFIENSATNFDEGRGGGMNNSSDTRPSLTNCSFLRNAARFGGGMYNDGADAMLTNCSFQGNSSVLQGGGMFNQSSSLNISNCSFQGNTATSSGGGGMYNASSSITASTLTLTNCVLFGNGGQHTINNISVGSRITTVTATYTLFEASETDYTGSNNLTTTVNPFASTSSTELSPCSPAIDAGNAAAYSGPATDLAGNPRQVRNIDMGAYEYQGTIPPPYTATFNGSTSICPGTSTDLSITLSDGTSSYTGVYSVSGGSNQTITGYQSGAAISVSPAQTTTYTLISVTDANGCTATLSGDPATVTVKPTPDTPTLSANPGTTTTNQPITVTASGCSGTVSWNTSGGTDNGNDSYTFPAAGNYAISATCILDGCVSDASQTLNLTISNCPAIGVQVSGNTSVVFGFQDGGNCTTLSASASGGTGPYSYVWKQGNTVFGQNISQQVCPESTTTYTVTATDANGCASEPTQVTVTVQDVRCGNQNQNVTICYYGTTQCVNRKTAERYLKLGATLGPCGSSKARIGVEETNAAPFTLTLKAFPNPVQAAMTLEVRATSAGPATFEIIDLTGRTRQTHRQDLRKGLNKVHFDLTAQPTGNYLIRCRDGLGQQAVVRVNRQ